MSKTCEVEKESRLVIVNERLSNLDLKLRGIDNNLSESLDSLVGVVPQDDAKDEEVKQNNGIIGELEATVEDLSKTANCLQRTINRVKESGIV